MRDGQEHTENFFIKYLHKQRQRPVNMTTNLNSTHHLHIKSDKPAANGQKQRAKWGKAVSSG